MRRRYSCEIPGIAVFNHTVNIDGVLIALSASYVTNKMFAGSIGKVREIAVELGKFSYGKSDDDQIIPPTPAPTEPLAIATPSPLLPPVLPPTPPPVPTTQTPPPIPEIPVENPPIRPRRTTKPSLAARKAAETAAIQQSSRKPKHIAKIAITTPSEAITTPSEPLTYEEALASLERDLWINAIHEELDSLARHNTWQLVPRPQYRNVIGTKWVFKIKDTIPCRFKARLVAQGFSQIPGIDYNETFAPVVKSTSVRTLFAIAVQEQFHIYQFDIETAFLNGILQEEIFVALPPAFINPLAGDHVLKLLKALYGLEQASNVWATAFFKHAMDKLNFIQSTADDSIFISPPESPHLIIVAIYVDDILIFSKNVQAIRSTISLLNFVNPSEFAKWAPSHASSAWISSVQIYQHSTSLIPITPNASSPNSTWNSAILRKHPSKHK
jgi:hypothetical protein